ncbi:hypothetical protein [Spirochaeta isovalerica]|uniref:Uncharacterized protein n=1 Tax=Spirochaeta isovalerica TaxID=150 RepID=A0A841RH06_9SPIO|nr:hypothetical protein [Spirochaeta isovalerica]MBB6481602.1 hypothetical protein [Spirochaeta isovalerica]
MIWVHRNYPDGFDDLSKAEMLACGLTQVSKRFFTGETFNLEASAYAGFSVEEMIRGHSAEEIIRDFPGEIPSPFRMEKLVGTYRYGSRTYALLAHKYKKGDIRASDPASIILVFTPDNGKTWIAGYLKEKKNSLVEKLSSVSGRTSVSLSAQAALAMVHLAPGNPVIDPCCGTGLIPLASVLLGRETLAADNNYKMIRHARQNRDELNLNLEIPRKDAFEPWHDGGCLVSDFPADRNWTTSEKDLGLQLFRAWIPHISSFCVILPEKVVEKLPRTIQISSLVPFTANRSIVVGTVKNG